MVFDAVPSLLQPDHTKAQREPDHEKRLLDHGQNVLDFLLASLLPPICLVKVG